MRVLLVNQYYWPDVAATAQHLTDLAEWLAARGHEAAEVLSRARAVDLGEGGPRGPVEDLHAAGVDEDPAVGPVGADHDLVEAVEVDVADARDADPEAVPGPGAPSMSPREVPVDWVDAPVPG